MTSRNALSCAKHIALRAAIVCGAISPALVQGAETIIDNGSPGYQGSLAWSDASAGTAQGGSHQVAAGLTGVIDNASAAFTTQGVWQTASSRPSFHGSNYATAAADTSQARHASFVIDNTTSTLYSRGCMQGTSTTAPGYYGRNYVRVAPNIPALYKYCELRYNTQLPGNLGGSFPVAIYAHWPAHAEHASNAKITVLNSSYAVVATFTVNQKVASGEWAYLGQVNQVAGTVFIRFDATNANGIVAADAVKIEAANLSTSKLARWQLPQGLSGNQDIYARWPEWTSSEAMPAWVLIGGDGSTLVRNGVSQRANGGQWRLLGRIHATGSQKNIVQLEHFGQTGTLVADAVAHVPAGKFPSATWTHATLTGPFDLHVSWVADPGRTTKALYVVKTLFPQGSSCNFQTQLVRVDQTVAPAGGRLLLGSFTASSDPACGGATVTLMPDDKPGTLSADAVFFVTP